MRSCSCGANWMLYIQCYYPEYSNNIIRIQGCSTTTTTYRMWAHTPYNTPQTHQPPLAMPDTTPFTRILCQIPLQPDLLPMLTGYLWGDRSDWIRKLNIVEHLPADALAFLTDVPAYRSYSNLLDTEDCLYCPHCGEKTLFFALSFYTDTCQECNAYT